MKLTLNDAFKAWIQKDHADMSVWERMAAGGVAGAVAQVSVPVVVKRQVTQLGALDRLYPGSYSAQRADPVPHAQQREGIMNR